MVSLDSVDESEQAVSDGTRCTLLMYDTRSSSGGNHGVHHMLLSSPAMHALRQVRLQRTSIDFPKMSRTPLGRLGAERFTVARHQHRDLTGRLRKMKQGAVNFRL